MRLKRVGVWLLTSACWLVLICTALKSHAMDDESSSDVASCPRRTGFEKDGKRALAILRKSGMQASLSYFVVVQGVKEISDDPKGTEGWLISVDVKNVAAARKLLAAAIKHGLHIDLVYDQ